MGKVVRLTSYGFHKYINSKNIFKSLKESALQHASSPPLCSKEMEMRVIAHTVKTMLHHKIKLINDILKEDGRNSAQSQRKLKILLHK